MKSAVFMFTLFFLALSVFSAIAADKVTVIPLNSSAAPAPQSLAIAWGAPDYACGMGSYDSYNVASCINDSTGNYTITLKKNFYGYPAVIASSYSSVPDNEIATAEASAPNTIKVHITDGAGAAKNSAFNFVVFGILQSTVPAGTTNDDIRIHRD